MVKARILFDEAHSEAWTISRERASALQPSHPADASYADAAAALAARDFTVAAHEAGPLTSVALDGTDVLVLAHPSDPKWEQTTGGHPELTRAELEAVVAWVRAGGGLIVLGETEQDKYGNNVNELLARFGARIENATVQDYADAHGAPSWIRAELGAHGRGGDGDLLARVDAACFYRTGVLELPEDAIVVARTSATASRAHAPLAGALEAGAGRVVVLGDSDLFGDDCLSELGHRELWENLIYWVAQPVFARAAAPRPSAAADDPHWAALKAGVEALRALQAPDGSVDRRQEVEVLRAVQEPDDSVDRRHHDPARHVARILAALRGLTRHFPHQTDHLAATAADLRAWAEGGFGVPDFGASLDAFRPDRHRADGIEHLVLFPMYKQNGPRERVFEALIVRVPWPAWLADLERTRYANPKFVPVEFVDFTSGYDSESAVLFPETVTTATRPVNHFGAIFCDREAARLRRTMARAAGILRINLPPDAVALLASADLARDAYILWDLVHDRAHSRGDLPFDPFMIRQRQPYWMYGLEELRCDLTAFREAIALEAEGFPVARHVSYAILYDRLFRFPITGERVRNYDGLGGQLLFAFLHREGHVGWTDNELTIDWTTVADGVGALRTRLEDLYRTGIDRTQLGHWAAAHDLVAEYVAPAAGSRWARGARDFPDVEDPRPYIDEVRADEFPLSVFYVSLKRRLGAELLAA